MGISLVEVIENRLISDEVLECIPHNCGYCGSVLEFTDSLKQIYCPNRYCALKVAARLEYMAKAMKADGWGESACREVCKAYKLKSPYQIFLLEGRDCKSIPAFRKKMESICDSEKRRVKLWEMAMFAAIPSIETIAYKIFGGYKTIEEAYADIETYQVPFIAEKLGLKNTDTGVLAVRIFNNLIEYKGEIQFGETQFEICDTEGMNLYVAITGGVYGYTNKAEFIKYINKRYQGKINAMLMNSVSSNIHVLVADGDTSSSKYKTARRLRDKGHNILITDSSGLIAWLDTLEL